MMTTTKNLRRHDPCWLLFDYCDPLELRASNCLEHHIHTIGDLVDLTDADLRWRVKGIGPKLAAIVREIQDEARDRLAA